MALSAGLEGATELDITSLLQPRQGYLSKLGGGQEKGSKWNRRWFVLRDNILMYFNSPKDFTGFRDKPSGVVLLEECNVRTRDERGAPTNRPFTFVISQANGESVVLAADSENEMLEWMQAVRTSRMCITDADAISMSEARRRDTAEAELTNAMTRRANADAELAAIEALKTSCRASSWLQEAMATGATSNGKHGVQHAWYARKVIAIYNYIAVNFRAVAMAVIVLPLSFSLRLLFTLLERYEYFCGRGLCGEQEHQSRAQGVADKVFAWKQQPSGTRRKLCTSRAPWQNLSMRFSDYKATSHCIHVGHLNSVVSLDEKSKTVHLEPMVTVGQITRFLVPRGYMLEATLEIDEATIGGLAMAVGMTTHAHVCGLLQETVVVWEIVDSQGKLLKVTRESDPELWATLPWSHGSLGLLVGLVMRVMPVEQVVKVTYKPFFTQESLCKAIREASLKEKPADFVESTIFSQENGLLMEASFEKNPPKIDRITRWYQPWFYVQCREKMAKNEPTVQYIDTYEYIFRHNRGIFWTLADQLPEHVAMHPLFRYALGWMFPPLVTFLKLPAQTDRIQGEMMYQRVYQDLVMPISALEEGIKLSTELFDIWPLLMYPSKVMCGRKGIFPEPRAEDVVPGKDYAMYMDLGCYGIPRQVRNNKPFEAIGSARKVEEFMTKRRGVPFLYANTFYTREEFEASFDVGAASLYEKVRTRTKAGEAFPHVFDKTSYREGWQQLQVKEHDFWKGVAAENRQ